MPFCLIQSYMDLYIASLGLPRHLQASSWARHVAPEVLGQHFHAKMPGGKQVARPPSFCQKYIII